VTTAQHERAGSGLRLARAALWLLPVYTLLLALSTLTHEPDHAEEFADWSRYVTTDVFVVTHVVGSILGAALGLVGIVAALLFLVRGPAATSAMTATALTVVGNVLFTGLFAAAAFAQPAIGRAFLAGQEGAEGLYDEVYGTPLLATFGVGALCFLAGAILFGRAVAHTSAGLRVAGWGYATALVLFVVSGFTVSVVQPVLAALACAAAVLIALRLPAAVGTVDEARAPGPKDRSTVEGS
jgi:hypothetical protein